MKHGKTWGTTRRVHADGGCAVDLLEVRQGGFSSEHRHARKSNLFFVVQGRLEVSVWTPGPEGEILDRTVLEAGESTTVPPGAWHMFRALADCTVVEVSHLAGELPLDADIERRRSGGAA